MSPIAGLAILCIAVQGTAAEPRYAFDAAAGKLPKTALPVHYAIELEPDMEKGTTVGLETVSIEVREPVARLVINAADLTISAASIDDEAQAATVALDAAAETATLSFRRPLTVGRHQLRIGFTGRINKLGRGLFSVDYPTAQGRKRMLATHLEPADARRVFPCWDEPAFKASFALTVTVPRASLAVSNMPVASEEPVTPTLKQVSFRPTPRMSSYLFVLAVGELERLSADVDDVAVSVVTTAGKRGQGRFALDSAARLLRYYNDYFGVKYPLPKLDLIAVPGGFGGAMENWGGITFFENRLLLDPTTMPSGARRGIFTFLAHEMAHQWFGNLVTTAWWDDLWLNEGFASWMEAKSADELHPEWRSWVNASAQKQRAMTLDARRSAHPIRHPVADESEAMAAFDGITYGKGQALIRMLEDYLGEDRFRDGIRRYMAEHAYSNSTTADLWRALETVSDKPVADIAAGFTEQPGVPLVVAQAVCVDGEQRLELRQERFTIAAGLPADEAPRRGVAAAHRWQVPVAFAAPAAPRASGTVLLGDRGEIAAGRCGDPLKLNFGDVGYYRVEYDAATRAALARSAALMAPADRVNLLADGWALVEAGRAEPQSYLDLVEEIGTSSDRAVWEQIIRTLERLDHLARDRPERDAVRSYARSRLRPALDRLGWEAAGAEGPDAEPLRARLIGALGRLGDRAVLAEAKRRFAGFLQDPAALRPPLREPVMHLVGLTADRATYDTLIALARKATGTGERVRYYTAAAGARDPSLAQRTLELTLTGELPSTLIGRVLNTVAADGEQPELAWNFVQQHFEALAERQGPSFPNYLVAGLMQNFTDRERAEELARFAPAHASSGGRTAAARAQEAIMISADLKARVLPAVADWIARRAQPRSSAQ
ncbi:MAG TPA: M1 family metallopeptidase [Xanthobacteraceae bacterium]